MANTCQMVRPHHPDCRCPTCDASLDEICSQPAVGTHSHDVRVCERCGRALEREGFVVEWNDARRTAKAGAEVMTVGDLLDTLGALHAACEDVDPPLSDDEWRALEIVVRGTDEDGNDFCGSLCGADIEQEHGCDEKPYLALDASNEPEFTPPKEGI